LGTIQGWEALVDALRLRLSPSALDDPVGAFTKLEQTTTVEEHQSQFEVLSNKVSGLTEEFRVSSFLSGLKEEIRLIITMLRPNSLPVAFGLAQLQEEEVNRRNKSFRGNNWTTSTSTFQSNRQAFPRLPPPPDLHRLPAPNRPTETRNFNPTYPKNIDNRPTIPMRRISLAQMQERREKWLCYFCDERYQPGHRCNKPKLYILEGMKLEEKGAEVEEEVQEVQVEEVESEELEGEGEILSISLHALARSPAPKTMRLVGKLEANESLFS
jgi:hypothetical protein